MEQQELIADTFRRERAALSASETVSETLFAFALAATVFAVWRVDPPHGFALAPALACVAVLAAAARVRIDTAFGFTIPTQVAFVPMLFAMPLATVPVGVIAGMLLARLPDVARGEVRPIRLLLTVCNGWFAIGPVLVFEIAGLRPLEAGPALLAAALVAQFGVDFVVATSRSWASREAGLGVQLSELWIYSIDAALSGIGLIVARDEPHAPVAVLSLLPLLGVLAMFARERRERLTGLIELNNAYRGTALVLGDVVEADDGYTGKHCRSVVQLALLVGERMGLGLERQRDLEFAALLHDVGKIAIPKEIINKPGKLDPHEWTIIRTHTLEGQKMLDRVGGFMRDVGRIVRSHHERWDGGGYPDGLRGEEIPLEARIIACCDSWNAMRTDRVYRPALSHEVAMTELLTGAGAQFDPRIVDILADVVSVPAEPAPITRPSASAAARLSESSALV